MPSSRIYVALLLVVSAASAQQFAVPVDPGRTYLRADGEAANVDTVPFDLGAVGIVPGQYLELKQNGAWGASAGAPESRRAMLGAFSVGPTLLPASTPARLPGAAAAGPAHATAANWFGAPTDIPEDFVFSLESPRPHAFVVRVPAGATHLFLSVPDDFWSDNVDADGDLTATLRLVAPPSWPGTGDDLVVASGVNGPAQWGPGADVKVSHAFDALTVGVLSPVGGLVGAPFVFDATLIVIGVPPPLPFPFWPEIFLDPFSPATLVIALDFATGIPPGGLFVGFTVPGGLGGLSALVQAVAFSATARNGGYAATDAHEIQYRP